MIARAVVLIMLPFVGAVAQSAGRRDTVHLADLQEAARRVDPRTQQVALERQASALRLRSIAADRLPSLNVNGYAQYQSAVTFIPINVPNVSLPVPPKDRYDGQLYAQQRLIDPTLGPRANVERASIAATEAHVQTTLYSLRDEVDEAFFSAALSQARASELTAVISDLEAELRVARARVREGTALPSEAATIEAELLRRRQDQADLVATRASSLAVLASLTGRAIAPTDTLALPDLGPIVATSRAALPHARPEYAEFARTREQLASQEQLVAAQAKPRVSAFAQLGYGRPGLNLLATNWNPYWLGGVQVQWAPWSWGTNERDREELAIQQQVVSTNEAAFTAATQRAVERSLADIDRLTASLATDDTIIVLRERIERETQHRFDEAVITASEYVDRRNDVLAARLTRASHEVELAQARARYLATIGVELPR
jgi:outer membrane protein TolC